MPRSLNVEEASRLTARNPELLRRLIRSGRLPASRDETGAYVIAAEDLLVLLDLRRSRVGSP